MRNAEMRGLTLRLSADVRAGRYQADMDLGKAEHLGESQELAQEYEACARPILEAFMAQGLITDEEFTTGITLGIDRDALADQLQALAESLLTD